MLRFRELQCLLADMRSDNQDPFDFMDIGVKEVVVLKNVSLAYIQRLKYYGILKKVSNGRHHAMWSRGVYYEQFQDAVLRASEDEGV